jgi:hypothetical protein
MEYPVAGSISARGFLFFTEFHRTFGAILENLHGAENKSSSMFVRHLYHFSVCRKINKYRLLFQTFIVDKKDYLHLT